MSQFREKTIQIGKQEIRLERFGLRKWMELEKLSETVYEAAGVGNPHDTAETIYRYLTAASGLSHEYLSGLSWMDVAMLFAETENLNACLADLPILKVELKKQEKAPWDYPQREWYSMANMLAAAYGWTLDIIAELDVDDAFPLVQEILTDEQMRKEWEWQTTEISYPYNKVTKTQEFKPLPRPEWMIPPAPKIKNVKWRKEWLPVGNVVDLSGMLNAEQKPN